MAIVRKTGHWLPTTTMEENWQVKREKERETMNLLLSLSPSLPLSLMMECVHTNPWAASTAPQATGKLSTNVPTELGLVCILV